MAGNIILVVGGLVLLWVGAEWFVKGSAALAGRLKISRIAIGLTVVAFGTSAPELVVNVFASLQGNHDIVFGSIIGSNNFNLFIILGIAGVIAPLSVQSNTAWREIPFSLAAVVIMFLLAGDPFFRSPSGAMSGRVDGLILLVLFGLFLCYIFTQLKSDHTRVAQMADAELHTGKIPVYIIAGLAGLIAGGRMVLKGSVGMATALHVSDKIIGLTLVAGGTSLPELATSVVATVRKNSDIAVGNIIGSNIFNVLFVLGIGSLVSPVVYSPVFNTDIFILACGTLFLLVAMYSGKRRRLDRWEASMLLVFYLAYTVYLIS